MIATHAVRLAAAALVVLALPGCERVMRDMYAQPRLGPATTSPLFGDGLASRPPPPDSVAHARGDLAATSSGREGEAPLREDDAAVAAEALPPRPSRASLLRGQERYDIYCRPCHGAAGDGDGRVVRRGFPAPPSYHQPRLIVAPDRHFYDVIGRGYGVMYPYADRVTPADRWAIVGYIRALQLSRHASLADLPSDVQAATVAALAASAPPPSDGAASAKATVPENEAGAPRGSSR